MSVSVRCGVNSLPECAVSGMTVGSVRSQLRQPLNIDNAAVPHVNGSCVTDTYVLNDGERLEFIKPAGQKGVSAAA